MKYSSFWPGKGPLLSTTKKGGGGGIQIPCLHLCADNSALNEQNKWTPTVITLLQSSMFISLEQKWVAYMYTMLNKLTCVTDRHRFKTNSNPWHTGHIYSFCCKNTLHHKYELFPRFLAIFLWAPLRQVLTIEFQTWILWPRYATIQHHSFTVFPCT